MSKKKNKNKNQNKSSNKMKWYLISFYYTDGRIESNIYSAVMLPAEYREALDENKHSIPKPNHVIFIDEFNSEKECKAAKGDAELVDAVFKIVEEDDKKADEAKQGEEQENK